MRRLTFVERCKALARLAQRLSYHRFDVDHGINAILSACGQKARVNLETFIKRIHNFHRADFADPDVECPKQRDATVVSMSAPGIFRVVNNEQDFRLFSIAGKLALQAMGLRPNMFRPLDPQVAADMLPTDTSTGAWWFRTPKGDYKQLAVDEIRKQGRRLSDYILTTTVAVVFWRTQERLSGTKFRQIFVLNYIFNIVETCFSGNMINYYTSIGDITSYKFHAGYETVQKPLYVKAQSYKHRITIDYRQFDRSISQEMIIYAFGLFKTCFSLNPFWDRVWKAMVVIHMSCPCFSQYHGKPILFNKKSGLLSGSAWTNLLGSVVNLTYLYFCLMKMGIDLTQVYLAVKSDDTVILSNVPIDINKLRSLLAYYFGAEVPIESVEQPAPGEPIYFLGYRFTDKFKIALSENLLHRKICISGRYISDDDLPENIRIVSKIISVLSNVSNGYEIFMRVYRDVLIRTFGTLPDYYHDLSQTEKGFSLNRVKGVWHELKYGWLTK